MSEKDLILFETNQERAKELGRKGGKTKTIAKALINRKKCEIKCPLFDKCNVKYLSEKQFEGQCALKQLPQKIQQRSINAIIKGKEGINNILIELLLEMSIKSDAGQIRTQELFDKWIKYYEVIHKTNPIIEINDEKAINFNDFRAVIQNINREGNNNKRIAEKTESVNTKTIQEPK